jgi:hypothetical protein
MWARREEPSAPPAEPEPGGELRDLMDNLALPAHVAGVTYGQGCRIRRVRVPALQDSPRSKTTRPVILSKRALQEARENP